MNMNDLPDGPDDAWVEPEAMGMKWREAFPLWGDFFAALPSKVLMRCMPVDRGFMCRFRVFEDFPAQRRSEVQCLVDRNDTVNVSIEYTFFHGVANNDPHITMSKEGFLFYLNQCFDVDNDGLLLGDAPARDWLQDVRDACTRSEKMVFYVVTKPLHMMDPLRQVQFCIRHRTTGVEKHFFMWLAEAMPVVFYYPDFVSLDNMGVRDLFARPQMFKWLDAFANSSCEPQARGAGSVQEDRLPRGAV